MKFTTKILAVSLVLVAGLAVAKDGVTDPTVMAREALMGVIGKNTGILGKMAGGEVAFDAAAAAAAKADLAAAASEIAAKFEPQATDPLMGAKPEIWTNWADFVVKADGLKAAAEALDATTVDGVKAGMAGIGGACKACHSVYRL